MGSELCVAATSEIAAPVVPLSLRVSPSSPPTSKSKLSSSLSLSVKVCGSVALPSASPRLSPSSSLPASSESTGLYPASVFPTSTLPPSSLSSSSSGMGARGARRATCGNVFAVPCTLFGSSCSPMLLDNSHGDCGDGDATFLVAVPWVIPPTRSGGGMFMLIPSCRGDLGGDPTPSDRGGRGGGGLSIAIPA